MNVSSSVKLDSNVVLRQVSHNVYDVFFGDQGWNDWSRIRVDKRLNRVFHLKGKNVPNALFQQLNKLLTHS